MREKGGVQEKEREREGGIFGGGLENVGTVYTMGKVQTNVASRRCAVAAARDETVNEEA